MRTKFHPWAYNRVAEAEEQSFTAYGHADDGHGVVKADGGRGEEEWWLKVGGFWSFNPSRGLKPLFSTDSKIH